MECTRGYESRPNNMQVSEAQL